MTDATITEVLFFPHAGVEVVRLTADDTNTYTAQFLSKVISGQAHLEVNVAASDGVGLTYDSDRRVITINLVGTTTNAVVSLTLHGYV